MENLNPTKNPITTIPGLLFIILGFLMYALPMFFDLKKDFSEMWYAPLLVIGVGTLLIFSPDSIVRGANKAIDKVSGDKSEDKK